MTEPEAGRRRKAGNNSRETEWLGHHRSSDATKSIVIMEERVLEDPVLPPAPQGRASVHLSEIWVLSTSWQPWLTWEHCAWGGHMS